MRYKEQCNNIWKRQLLALTNDEIYDSDSDDSEVDVDETIDEVDESDPFANVLGDKAAEVDDFNELIQLTSGPQNIPQINTSDSDNPVPSVIFDENRKRPAKVVKSIKRFIKPDGTECIEVSFKISDDEVSRVERETLRKRVTQKVNDFSIKRPTASTYASIQAEVANQLQDYNNFDGMKINMRAITDKAKKAKDQLEELLEAISCRNKENERIPPFILSNTSAPSESSNEKSEKIQSISKRLPRVEFCAHIEQIVMNCWSLEIATPFRHPVARSVPGYYDLIKRPICLTDIRKKLGYFFF